MYLPWSDRPGCHDFAFSMLSFKPAFSLPSFTFIKRLFSSSSLSAIRFHFLHIQGYWYFWYFCHKVSLSAYPRLLIFLHAILIPASASSSPTFCMMYSAYKLNKQGDITQALHTSFLIWNQSVVPCPVLLLLDLHTDFSGGKEVRWSSISISSKIFHGFLLSTQLKTLVY